MCGTSILIRRRMSWRCSCHGCGARWTPSFPRRWSTPCEASGMSFERLRRVPRTVGFRLAVWSSAFFVASTLVSFGLAYVLVSSSLQQSERASIQMELDELAARYRSGGLPGLAQELAL